MKNLLNFLSTRGKRVKNGPVVPTNNPTNGLSVSKLTGQNANPGKRRAPSPSMRASRKVKRPIKKSYNFAKAEKKLGVVQS
jgi:hypothetical protein